MTDAMSPYEQRVHGGIHKMKRLMLAIGSLALVVVIGAVSVGSAFAQTTTPPATTTPAIPHLHGFGYGGSTATFDAVAEALNLTPTELFEQLHSGKSLTDIAAAQGVDMQKVQDAIEAARTQEWKDRIAQAVTDGEMTQAQADWLLQGLEQGYLPHGGFFGGRGHRGGMRGFGGGFFGPRGNTAPTATPTPGTSS